MGSGEVGMELRYGPRGEWPLKNMIEWARKGGHGSYRSEVVYRNGPPLPNNGWPKKHNKNTKTTEKMRRNKHSAKLERQKKTMMRLMKRQKSHPAP